MTAKNETKTTESAKNVSEVPGSKEAKHALENGATRGVPEKGANATDSADATTTTKDGEVTVHVDASTSAADKDPSHEHPYAQHTIGTEGVLGVAAGSQTPRVVPTGNAGHQPILPDLTNVDSGEDKRDDVRDLQPKNVEAKRKEEEKKFPTDFSLEVDGDITDELTLKDAAEQAFNAATAGSTSPIIHKKGKRFATFAVVSADGQKHIDLKPEDGSISDEEAEVLNSYHTRVLTGALPK
jgi:hypothetical protein